MRMNSRTISRSWRCAARSRAGASVRRSLPTSCPRHVPSQGYFPAPEHRKVLISPHCALPRAKRLVLPRTRRRPEREGEAADSSTSLGDSAADILLTKRLTTAGHGPAPERIIALRKAPPCSTIEHRRGRPGTLESSLLVRVRVAPGRPPDQGDALGAGLASVGPGLGETPLGLGPGEVPVGAGGGAALVG